jgi:predicted nucleic acid-binding protein
MNLILDASVFLAILLKENNSHHASEIVSKASEEGLLILVPALFELEVSNTLLTNLKRKILTKEEYSEACFLLDTFGFEIDYLTNIEKIRKLALAYVLTTYDASYLELAIRKHSRLISFDKKLISAASSCGVAYA